MSLAIETDTTESLEIKYAKLRQGQKKWAQTKIQERIAAICRFSELLNSHKERLARTLTSDMGKPITQARREIDGARSRIQYFIAHSEQWLTGAVQNETADMQELLMYEPLGVITNISAWNYPYLIGVNVFIPALIGGNSVLYKPSSFCNQTGLCIQELLHEAGVPPDVFITALGDREVAQQLLDMPFNGYFFTGSTQVGRLIAQKVAPRMVPMGLELGGKDPLYSTNDVKDIKQVAEAAADGAFYNAGQSCCAVERIYVHQDIYEPFVKHFVDFTKSLKVGDPLDEQTYIGPLTQLKAADFLNNQIQDALSKGATLLCGGPSTRLFTPTVLVNVNHTMDIMKEESFGPIIGIQKVKNDEEAITLMNDSEYGLTASVYTSDQMRGRTILSQVNTGTAYINCCDRVTPYLPWSGRNASGIGSTLSYLGILAFVKPKGYQIRK